VEDGVKKTRQLHRDLVKPCSDFVQDFAQTACEEMLLQEMQQVPAKKGG
jgi:hypothetical protein